MTDTGRRPNLLTQENYMKQARERLFYRCAGPQSPPSRTSSTYLTPDIFTFHDESPSDTTFESTIPTNSPEPLDYPIGTDEGPYSSRAVGYGSNDSLYPLRRQRPAPPPSSSYTSAVNSLTMSECYTSTLNSPARASTPLNTHSSSDSLSAAAYRF